MRLYLAWYRTLKDYSIIDKDLFNEINFLETYIAFNDKLIKKEYIKYKKTFFLDSWAFSAYTLWKKIDLKEYSEFIKRNNNYLRIYANLDVIWNAKATLENQKEIESFWLNPLPTYHFWSEIKYFEKYVNEYKYIWIWWLVPYASQPDKIRKLCDYIFNYIFKNKLKTKLHWRWLTNPKIIKKYPFYSVDSTWRIAWWKFNRIMFYNRW